ncbi:choline sulfate utilization transcriptional regulator [Pokkaliibacter sp. CJK22405]|uniref:choline sulfate utilization transcriptional regulator n=1 Tax=Pokkaliibacter sp. CJK22405 TaxID=3384615 RepID=UPI003984B6D4
MDEVWQHGIPGMSEQRGNSIPISSVELLRVFESSARLGSFTSCATELGMTQPAVSQQIRRLEQELEVRLFDRVYRGILLTEAGRQLFESTTQGFGYLAEGLEAVRRMGQHEVLNIATDFAFAAYWLMPRMMRFQQRYPETDVNLITSERNRVAIRPDVDVAIVFGDGRSKNADGACLFKEEVYPVSSPRFLNEGVQRTPEELRQLPLLHLQPGINADWFTWQTLLPRLGVRQPLKDATLSFDNYTLLIQAAIAGQGVAIGWRYLTDELVNSGILCRLTAQKATSEFGYHLLIPERKRRIKLIQQFVDWVQEELETQRQHEIA